MTTTRYPGTLPDEDSDAASEVYNMASPVTRAEDLTAVNSTFDAAPRPSTSNADSFEIPKTPSMTTAKQCPVYSQVVKVLNKRLDAGLPQYLVLSWMSPLDNEAAYSSLHRHI